MDFLDDRSGWCRRSEGVCPTGAHSLHRDEFANSISSRGPGKGWAVALQGGHIRKTGRLCASGGQSAADWGRVMSQACFQHDACAAGLTALDSAQFSGETVEH